MRLLSFINPVALTNTIYGVTSDRIAFRVCLLRRVVWN